MAAPGLSCGTGDLHCSMQALVPQPEIEPRPPALGVWSLTHWTTREVCTAHFLKAKCCASSFKGYKDN